MKFAQSETINKMNKAKLDQVFSLNSSDEVFSFMKDYAYKNQDLSAALIRHFLPDDIVSAMTEPTIAPNK